MKFLCTDCDTAMKFKDVTRPEQGSVTALFECPDCFTEIAMFLNPSETQMLKSLDLKLGGTNEAAQPMQLVRSQLETTRENRCLTNFPPETSSSETAEGGKCPFTGVISDAFQEESEPAEPTGPAWTAEALERLERIPAFVRRWRKWELKVSPKITDTTRLQAKSWMPPAETSPHSSNNSSNTKLTAIVAEPSQFSMSRFLCINLSYSPSKKLEI